MCVELHVFIDPSAGVYEAYLDGVLVIRSPAVNTLTADGYLRRGGRPLGRSEPVVEVYVDDVGVGTSRTPCD